MFDNIGGKIKVLAKVICWIGIACSCLVGIVMWNEAVEWEEPALFFSGLLIAGIGSLASWLSSFVLCGFGQLIENSDELVEQGKARIGKSSEAENNTNVGAEPNTHMWRCSGCGRMINTEYCAFCGAKAVTADEK